MALRFRARVAGSEVHALGGGPRFRSIFTFESKSSRCLGRPRILKCTKGQQRMLAVALGVLEVWRFELSPLRAKPKCEAAVRITVRNFARECRDNMDIGHILRRGVLFLTLLCGALAAQTTGAITIAAVTNS